jgi:hypothetical protein
MFEIEIKIKEWHNEFYEIVFESHYIIKCKKRK